MSGVVCIVMSSATAYKLTYILYTVTVCLCTKCDTLSPCKHG